VPLLIISAAQSANKRGDFCARFSPATIEFTVLDLVRFLNPGFAGVPFTTIVSLAMPGGVSMPPDLIWIDWGCNTGAIQFFPDVTGDF